MVLHQKLQKNQRARTHEVMGKAHAVEDFEYLTQFSTRQLTSLLHRTSRSIEELTEYKKAVERVLADRTPENL